MTWVVAVASLWATWLNIRKLRLCFAVWFVTNCAWCAVDVAHGVWARAPLDATYAVLAAWGWRAWWVIASRVWSYYAMPRMRERSSAELRRLAVSVISNYDLLNIQKRQDPDTVRRWLVRNGW